ncbi:hypothetical protein A2U01_0099959, partial [Trifolium medium]|nr:hypothetical protein [Trifolium medium]
MSWPRAFDIIVGSAHRRTDDIKIYMSSCSLMELRRTDQAFLTLSMVQSST